MKDSKLNFRRLYPTDKSRVVETSFVNQSLDETSKAESEQKDETKKDK